jgi:hypothetical protein
MELVNLVLSGLLAGVPFSPLVFVVRSSFPVIAMQVDLVALAPTI